ncbi:hypothetical protein CMI47_19420 [Candidatus Pacearchaeota archaeon]|nr:hypothetical protein [Candidatus Pacearchaeota archaeon]|tara:strand:+ start:153 stop:371 length:219 start_codon:yes stop_codon:yes gene_type:complete
MSERSKIYDCVLGDLVKVVDGFDREPTLIGIGLFLGIENKLNDITGKDYAIVLVNGREQWFDEPYWKLERIS